jgi:BirA family biotin operon repressor/biotin-[acetyl-CoA-carboxylase] ligase
MMFPALRFRLEQLEECTSTNEILMNRREREDFAGTALLALHQTSGQGRRGREWWSGKGNLALSLAFRSPSADVPATLYSNLVGIAAYAAIRPILPPECDLRLKWPNDIYLNGKKLAGMLAQARQGTQHTDIVVGIGLNLREAPPGLERESVALGNFIPALGPAAFARSLLQQLERCLNEIRSFEDLKNQWEKAARLTDTEIRVVGEEDFLRPLALLRTGELEVEGKAGRRRLASEDVSIRLRS